MFHANFKPTTYTESLATYTQDRTKKKEKRRSTYMQDIGKVKDEEQRRNHVLCKLQIDDLHQIDRSTNNRGHLSLKAHALCARPTETTNAYGSLGWC